MASTPPLTFFHGGRETGDEASVRTYVYMYYMYLTVGMQPWEEKYSEMAVAMGIDPKVSLSIFDV